MSSAKIGVIVPENMRHILFSPQDWQTLNELGDVRVVAASETCSSDEALALLTDCEIGVGTWGTPYPDSKMMDACPNLALWVHAAGTVKQMFGPHLDGRDFHIISCSAYIAECVAQLAVAEAVVGSRQVLVNAALNRENKPYDPQRSKSLYQAKVGVVGASWVGRAAIRLLKHFGNETWLYDPFVDEAEAAQLGVRLEQDLTALCAGVDVVTLHTPSLPATAKMMGREQFQAMPDDGVFINTSRGSCVDEEALIAELEKGRLFAFLDVSDPEPCAPDSPFRRLPNVVYTSHIAGAKGPNIGRQVVEDIADYLAGKDLRHEVRREMLKRIA